MTRRSGNPATRLRGEAVRAVLVATVKPEQPMPLEAVCSLVGLEWSGVCRHLAMLVEAKRIRGYTTAKGMVRVW
jgi:predicted ArsR family transcriptional regulator